MLKKTEWPNALKELTKFLRSAEGIAFCIVTRSEDGGLQYHPRNCQPCYGELRKYRRTHGDEATNDDSRPGDLRHPFPEGKPVALALRFHNPPNEFTNFLWSDRSPWKKGFKSEKNLIYVPRGVILKDLKIDPTVLVNLLINMRYTVSNIGTWRDLINDRVDPLKACFLIFMGGYSNFTFSGPQTYMNSVIINVSRFMNQDPRDLTGGTLENRYDYNRKQLAHIFRPEEEGKGLNLYKALSQKFPDHHIPTDRKQEFYDYVDQLIKQEMEQ